MYNILICDDDRDIVAALKIYLTAEGYRTLEAYSGREALDIISRETVHLALLDIMMPGFDGLAATAALREKSNIPVILLTAKSEDTDKVLGLSIGADDYLTKPFGTAELLARVRTAIRHTRTTSPTGEIAQRGTYSVGEMVIDYNKHQVLVRGENVRLTLSEFRIVALLGKFAGKVLTYDYIIKELWGPRAGGDNQILRVNMANIRRKIEKNPAEPEYLFTEVGVGYRMAENPSGE